MTPSAMALPSGMVTFLLTDVEGSTALWEEHLAVMGEVLARHDELMNSIVEAHHGTLLRARGEGDSTFSVFARATDAAQAALAAQEAFASEPWPSSVEPRVRMAIHVGETFDRDGEYYGATVNRAARLRAAAAGGQIVLSSSTADMIVDHLVGATLVELGELSLQGLRRAERVFELRRSHQGEAAGFEPADDGALPPLPVTLERTATGAFVGREAQLAQLHALWEDVCAGHMRLAFVSGEPGIGKTRLAAEFARQVHGKGALVIFGRCDEDAGEPYQPFAEGFRTYLGALPPAVVATRLGSLAPMLIRLVPDLQLPELRAEANGSGDADAERRALFDAVAAHLRSAALATPVLVVVDDLHWAARPTLALLRQVLRTEDIGRVMVIGTYRATDVDRSHPLVSVLADLRRERQSTRISLGGLDADGVVDYMEATAGQALEDGERRLAQAVHAETDGNPLFLVELLRHLVETGALYRTEGRWHADFDNVREAGLPEGVRDVVTRRLGRLSKAANKALAAAAVVGPEFDFDLLDRVPEVGATDEELLDALEEAVRAGVVAETGAGRYVFSHALIRQTLYEELTSTRRARLHRRVGEAIESLPDAGSRLEALAHHFAEGTLDGQADKAADYALAAGHQAIERLAHEQAISHLERGLEALEVDASDHIRMADLYHALAVARWSGGERSEARATAQQAATAARSAHDSVRFARSAVLAIGTVGYMVEDSPMAELCEEALALLGDERPKARARLLAGLARYRALCEGHGPEGEALARDAVLIARSTDDAPTLSSTLNALYLAMQGLGDPQSQLLVADELVELARTIANRRALGEALHARSVVRFAVADIPGLEHDLAELDALGNEHRWWRPLGVSAALRAGLAATQGRFSQAEALEVQALRQASADSDIVTTAAASALARALLVADYDRAAEICTGAAEASPGLAPHAAGVLAFIEVAAGRLEISQNHRLVLTDALAIAPANSARPILLALLAEAVARTGERALGEGLYRSLNAFGGQIIVISYSTVSPGVADRYLGMLAALEERWADSEAHYIRALDLETRIGAVPLLAATRYWYARMLLGRREHGDQEKARELLMQARSTALELGLKQVLADVSELIQADY